MQFYEAFQRFSYTQLLRAYELRLIYAYPVLDFQRNSATFRFGLSSPPENEEPILQDIVDTVPIPIANIFWYNRFKQVIGSLE
jgi:hypothetical protein